MENFSIEDKTILITGASSGIGKQLAIDLSSNGAKVIIVGRNKSNLQNTFSSLVGEGHLSFEFDLSNVEQIKELINSIPNIDAVVHSAGITSALPVKYVSIDEIEKVFSINFNSVVLINAALLRNKKLNKPASIVCFSSMSTKYPYYGGSVYASSKSALETYVKYFALETAQNDIRINCIQPSFVKTPMTENSLKNVSEGIIEGSKKLMPLGYIDINDIYKTVIFLISESSKWLSGTIIPMGGG